MASTMHQRQVSCNTLAKPMTMARPMVFRRASVVVRSQTEVSTAEKVLQVQTGTVNSFNAVDFEQLQAAAGSRLLVVDVFTTWCGPCKMIAPEIENMAQEFGENVVFSKIDCTSIPENKKFAMGQGVKALPTFLMFKEGKRVNDMTGAKAAQLKKLVEAHM